MGQIIDPLEYLKAIVKLLKWEDTSTWMAKAQLHYLELLPSSTLRSLLNEQARLIETLEYLILILIV